MIRNKLSVFILAVESLTVITVLQSSRKKLDNHSVAIALISAESLTDTAECCKCRIARTNFLQSFACITADFLAVSADNSSRMNILAYSFIILNFTVLSNRSCAIDNKIKFFIGWNTDSKRVGTEHTVNTKGRRNRRTCICTRNTNTALLCCHSCIIAGNTIVAGITNGNHTHTVFFCLINSHLH